MSQVDADVYWKYMSGTSDYSFTPSFQNGDTTLPAELVMSHSVGYSGLNSAAAGDMYWQQGMTDRVNSGQGYGMYSDHGPTTTLNTRTDHNIYHQCVYRDSDVELQTRIQNFGYGTDGRNVYINIDQNDIAQYTVHTSLRFGEQPWRLTSRRYQDQVNESNWKIPLGFAPDWVWGFTGWSIYDEWATIYQSNPVCLDVFAHRDGTIESHCLWDQDGQANQDCGTNYDTTNFATQYWDNALWNQIGACTFQDWGISLDYSTNATQGLGTNLCILAGKNENSAVGHFTPGSSDAGWRASDSTVKITTGFKPRIIFLRSGNRGSTGHTVDWISTRGFIGPNGADQWSQCVVGDDNTTTGTWRRSNYSNSCLNQMTRSGTTDFTLTYNAMEDDGFRLNATDEGYVNVSYLAIGDPPDAVVPAYGESIL
jgi:hypothetical protein